MVREVTTGPVQPHATVSGAGDHAIDVRPMSAVDATGPVDLVRTTYGDDYGHEEIYEPEPFLAAQERGDHVSEVAVAPDSRIDRKHWHLLNDHVEALADAVIGQAAEAFSRRS